MGKRQRNRMRASLATYAAHALKVIYDDTGDIPAVSLADIEAAQREAERVASGTPLPAAPPTSEEMLMRAAHDASQIHFQPEQRVWRLRDGKEGMVFGVKFTPEGLPVYRITTQAGIRSRHLGATVFETWSPNRVYFPVDINTGRPILSA